MPRLAPNSDTAPDTAAANQTAAAAKKRRPRYPPLVVEKLPNWAAHFRALATKLGRPPNARPFRTGVRFSPESEDEYRVVQRYLTALEKEEGISWFAYSLPADKKLKVAIRGLPADTPPQEIEEELRRLGYEPEYVRHINARQGRPGCVFYALLTKTQDVRQVYDTTVFMNMRGVKIEAWRGKRGPAQCHRCQQFRHSSHQCHRPLACVRCGEGHAARDCTRPREEPATCANCQGPHPACSLKCPIFQKEIQHKRAGTVAITTTQPRRTQTENKETERPTEEAQGASLMAAANGPTNRGDATSLGRRKKKRGGKGRRPNPSATEPATEATSEAAPVPPTAQAVTKKATQSDTGIALAKRAATNNCAEESARRTEKAAGTTHKPQLAQQKRAANKEFTACAIQLLMDLIKAIRQGQDAEQIILDGLAALLTLYHHV